MADAIGQLITKGAVHAQSESALLAPIGTPRISDDPVLITDTSHVVSTCCRSKADYCDAMIDFLAAL